MLCVYTIPQNPPVGDACWAKYWFDAEQLPLMVLEPMFWLLFVVHAMVQGEGGAGGCRTHSSSTPCMHAATACGWFTQEPSMPGACALCCSSAEDSLALGLVHMPVAAMCLVQHLSEPGPQHKPAHRNCCMVTAAMWPHNGHTATSLALLDAATSPFRLCLCMSGPVTAHNPCCGSPCTHAHPISTHPHPPLHSTCQTLPPDYSPAAGAV